MKIGVITQPLHNNYGGLLQNYALQQVLDKMGHNVETINWSADQIVPIKSWLLRKKVWMQSLFNRGSNVLHYEPNAKEKTIISKFTKGFVDNYIKICPVLVKRSEDFRKAWLLRSYDALIVGSDQVWRPLYNPFQTAMFFDFVDNEEVKRIAYAASFGTSKWEFSPAMTETCARLVKEFDLVTVREKSGVELCRDNLGVEAQHVLDPTLLLSKVDYERLVETENEPESEGTLFHYILDPSAEKNAFIEQAAKAQGLIPFTIMPKFQAENRTRKDVKRHIMDCVFPSVTSWLRGFMDAKMVIVDSFHGAVFSIIFNKPFWVIENNKRGSARFESLLGLFQLEDRMITVDTIQTDSNWCKEIDWGIVNSIWDKEKKKSILLLREILYR